MTVIRPKDAGLAPSPLTEIKLSTLTWVDITGKLDVSDAANGGFTQESGGAAYSPETRDAAFGYIDLFEAIGAGNDIMDEYTSVEIVLTTPNTPTGTTVVGCVALVMANDSMAAEPGMYAGVEWNGARTEAAATVGVLGSAPMNGADNGTSPGPVLGDMTFADDGLNKVGARHGAVSQTSTRAFQSSTKTNAMRLCLCFYNEGTAEAAWAGVTLSYRLNIR